MNTGEEPIELQNLIELLKESFMLFANEEEKIDQENVDIDEIIRFLFVYFISFVLKI